MHFNRLKYFTVQICTMDTNWFLLKFCPSAGEKWRQHEFVVLTAKVIRRNVMHLSAILNCIKPGKGISKFQLVLQKKH